MKNIKFKSKYFLLTLLMSCKIALASNTFNPNDTDQDQVQKLRSGVENFPAQLAQRELDDDSIPGFERTLLTKVPIQYSKTTEQDWELYEYPENKEEKTSCREETFKYHTNNSSQHPLNIIKITFNKSDQVIDIICYFNCSFPDILSEYKTKYSSSRDIDKATLRFKYNDESPEVNFAPYRQLHADGILPDFIIKRILELPNFKVTDFDYSQAKTKLQSSTPNYQPDEEAKQSLQSAVSSKKHSARLYVDHTIQQLDNLIGNPEKAFSEITSLLFLFHECYELEKLYKQNFAQSEKEEDKIALEAVQSDFEPIYSDIRMLMNRLNSSKLQQSQSSNPETAGHTTTTDQK